MAQIARTALAIVGATMMPAAAFPWGGLPRGASLSVLRSRIPIASAVQDRSTNSWQISAPPHASSAMLGAVLVAAVASTTVSDAVTNLEEPLVSELSQGAFQIQQRGGALPRTAAADALDPTDLDWLWDFIPSEFSAFPPESVRGASQPTSTYGVDFAEGVFNTNIG